MSGRKWYLGIDFGGSKLKIGFTSPYPRDIKIKTISSSYTFDDIKTQITYLPFKDRIFAIGISCPGDVDYEQGVIKKSLRLGNNISITKIVRKAVDKEIPVYLLNDAQAAALAELYLGRGKKEKSFLFINLGSAPGGAIVLDKHLLINSNGRTLGRVGHLCLDPNGPTCRCGKKGCWDVYLSAKSIQQLAEKLLSQNFSLPQITKLANEGNIAAQEIWKIVAFHLAQGVADLSNFLGIETIVISGGISLAGKWLFDPLRKRVSKLSRYPLRIFRSGIDPRSASVKGAIILAEKGYNNLKKAV